MHCVVTPMRRHLLQVMLLLEQVANSQRIATMQMKEADGGGRKRKGKHGGGGDGEGDDGARMRYGGKQKHSKR
jgi:hypothetical protein